MTSLPHTTRERARATLLVLGSACCFGSISILTIIGVSSGSTLTTLMIGRYALAALLLVACFGNRGLLRVGRRRALYLMAFFGGAQALVAALSLAALAYIPAAMMSFLFYTFPATVAIVAAVTRMERLTPVRLIALSLSLTGIVVMVGAPWALEADITGVLLAFAAGVVYAIYVIAVSRSEGGTHPVTIATYVSVGAGLIFLVFGTATGQITANPHPTALGAMAALAVFSTVLAFLGFLKGLAVLGSVRTSIISTVEPFWTALLGALVLGQQVTPAILMGGGLIAAAVVLLQLRRE